MSALQTLLAARRMAPAERRISRDGEPRDSRSACPVFWGRHHADLRQEAEHIFLRPLLDQLALGDAVDGDRGHLQVVAGARRPREIAVVFPDRGQAGDDLVAFGDLVVNAVVAWRRLPEDLERLLEPFSPGL